MASECLLVEILKNQAQKVTELFSKTHLGSNCYVPLADVHDDKIVKQRYDEVMILLEKHLNTIQLYFFKDRNWRVGSL